MTTDDKREKGTTRFGRAALLFGLFLGLVVFAAGGMDASAATPSDSHAANRLAPGLGGAVPARITSSVRSVQGPTHTVWQAGEATVTGSIAPGTRLRVHAVLNQACKIGHIADAACRPQSLLGWETISEDGTFSPVPAPVAPYGVCEGDTAVVTNGHTIVISRQLFRCFTLQTATD